MATITGLTAERMVEMENATVVDGTVSGDNLILITREGTQINAGSVRGPQGIPGPTFIVCTSTTRPAFTAGDVGKAIFETDTKLIRMWMGTHWKLQEKIICTSTTRPAMIAVDEGVKIYETDTDIEYIWNGTSWIIDPANELSRCMFQLILNVSQNFQYDGVSERVRFDAKYDPANIATVGANAGITVPRTGWMMMMGGVTVTINAAASAHNIVLSIVSGDSGAEVTRLGQTSGGPVSAGIAFAFTGNNVFKVTQGQKFHLACYFVAVGAGKAMYPGHPYTFFSGYYI